MRQIHNIGYLLNHVASVLGRQSDQALQEYIGFGLSQLKIMMALQSAPHLQQKQIAERLGQTEASISRQMKIIQDQSLLRVSINPANRREHVIQLTQIGEKATERAVKFLDEYHTPVFDALDSDQKYQLKNALELMHKVSCSIDRPGSCHQSFEK